MKKKLYIVLIIFILLIPSDVYAKSGCCSCHGRVSYCDRSVGRYVCNDGTYSKSCTCTKTSKKTTTTTTTATTKNKNVTTVKTKSTTNSSNNGDSLFLYVVGIAFIGYVIHMFKKR